MKRCLLSFLSPFLFLFSYYSQTLDSGRVDILMDPHVNILLEKWQQKVNAEDGKIDGYRIQIHFGVDKTIGKDIKTKFQMKYPNITAYEMYDQPNFKVRVGDFRTKLDAYKVLKEVSLEFPGCFIVEDQIEPPKLD